MSNLENTPLHENATGNKLPSVKASEAQQQGAGPRDLRDGVCVSRWPRFRAWLVSEIISGAPPKQVARRLQIYRTRFLDSHDLAWSDGKPELPTNAEIDALASSETWAEADAKVHA